MPFCWFKRAPFLPPQAKGDRVGRHHAALAEGTHYSQRQAADELRWRSFGAWMARLCPDAFPSYWPWQDIAPMRSRRGLGRENTGSRQHIAAMYSDTAYFGKICVLCVQKAPQSAAGECTVRTSCRQGAFSPSEALRSCTAHESCHPPVALPLRRVSCPSSCIAGSPFNGLALAQGCLPPAPRRYPPPANACHSVYPSQSETSRRWASAAVIRRMACSPAKPRGTADRIISTGRPTTECCAELGLNSKTVNKWAQNRRQRPQVRPVLRQRCRKRPSKERVPLDGTIGTPPPPQTKGDRVGRHHAALAEGVTPRGPGRRCSLPKLRG